MHVTIFHVGKHKRHFSNNVQLTCRSQRSFKLYCICTVHAARISYTVKCTAHLPAESLSCETTLKDEGGESVCRQIQCVDPQENHTFLWPLSPYPFHIGLRCFGLYRYSLASGTPSRSLAHSFWDTLYIYIYVHICMSVWVQIRAYVCTYVCKYVRKYECMYACINVCRYVCMYECMYVCK